MRAHDVVLGARAPDFVNAEVQPEVVLALQAFEVPPVELREDDDEGRVAGELDVELLMIVGFPGDIDANPALTAAPAGVAEEPRAVEVLILGQEGLVGKPEHGVVAEAVVQLLLDVGRPLLGSVGIGAFPNALS